MTFAKSAGKKQYDFEQVRNTIISREIKLRGSINGETFVLETRKLLGSFIELDTVPRTLGPGSSIDGGSNMKTASARHAAGKIPFLGIPSAWPSHKIDLTRWLSTIQGRIAETSADGSHEYQTIGLDRWENEGGRVKSPDGVASADALVEKE